MKRIKSHKTFGGETSYWLHASTQTQTDMKLATFIPDGDVKGCIVWLSGLTCNEENFITKAGAQRTLAQEQLMVIAPDTSPRGLQLPGEHDSSDFGSGAGFYVDATVAHYDQHYRMYSYVVRELYRLIQEFFQMKKISIMGHSMGGHGALVMGLRNPALFQSVSAFSPIVHPTKAPWGIKALQGYLGADRQQWLPYDSCELLKNGHRHPSRILIHQGERDEFLSKQLLTDDFVQAAQEADQDHEVKYCEGYDHSYYFISSFIDEHIRHHAKYLRG